MVKRKNVAMCDAGDGNYSGSPPDINLTQEQSTTFQDVRAAFFQDTYELRSEIFQKEHDLALLMHEKSIDAEKAKKLHAEILGLQSQIARKRLQAQLDARKDAI